jgi:hypothetical protein
MISKRAILSSTARRECMFNIDQAEHLQLWYEIYPKQTAVNPENVLPIVRCLYAATHFLQLRQWCSAMACKVSAELHPSSPVFGGDASSIVATTGGTVAPYMQLSSKVLPLPPGIEADDDFATVREWASDRAVRAAWASPLADMPQPFGNTEPLIQPGTQMMPLPLDCVSNEDVRAAWASPFAAADCPEGLAPNYN